MQKKIFKIILIYLLVIVILQSILWVADGYDVFPLNKFNDGDFILKIKPLNYAMVFAHGGYKEDCSINETIKLMRNISIINCLYGHVTLINNETVWTIDLLDNLSREGYDKVWLSQCHTGDNVYMISYPNGTYVTWYDWVSRNERPGNTIPIFWGLGFYRLAI